MTLEELSRVVPNFDRLTSRELICHFVWFLHVHGGKEVASYAEVRSCFKSLHLNVIDVTVYMPQLAAKRDPDLLKRKGGYALHGKVRRVLDAKYGSSTNVVVVGKMLSDLPAKLGTTEEREFLTEALTCYRAAAYRSSIVMAWNLAYDHLVRWIIKDQARLDAFNAAIISKFPKRNHQVTANAESFEEFTEAETVELCRVARLLSKNIVDILREKLKRRNAAAHPSQVIIRQMQADDVISDLVENVVLKLI